MNTDETLEESKENLNKVKHLADALGATVDIITTGGDRSTWFCVNRLEWVNYIRANPQRYEGVRAWEAYARYQFNRYFIDEVRRSNPDARIGKIPAYKKVFEWILGNYGKGLFLIGRSGTGKTAIINALRNLFADGHAMWYDNDKKVFVASNKVFSYYKATELMSSKRLDEALNYRFIMIDDIGVEPETSIDYGQRRNPVIELIDNIERKSGLVIMTSNLSADELSDKYGERTIDRINQLCKTIAFVGESFRGLNFEEKAG